MKGCTIGQAFDEVLAKGSIANRAMNSGSVCMKDVASFRRGIETMERTAAKDAQNREIARSNGSADSTRNLSAIADNLAEKSKNLLKNVDKAFAETNPPAQCADLLDGMHAKCRTITARMTEISKQLRKGTLTDREKILAPLFDMKEFSELSGMLRNIHIKIKDAAPGNTALLDFSNNLAVYIKSVNGEYDGLRNEYKRAVAADLLPVANQKLNGAVVVANKKGLQASIPQKIFDDLGGFIGDSPFAKMRLIESFCKELADNGDAKFRFGAEQKAELEGLFKNVLGESPRTEKAFARFVQEFEASAAHLRDRIEAARPRAESRPEALTFKLDYKTVRVEPARIRYVESMSEYLKIWLRDEPAPLVVLYSLKRLAEQLPEDRFLRIHRSYLVNLSAIREYSRTSVTLDGGPTLPVGDLYRPALAAVLSGK